MSITTIAGACVLCAAACFLLRQFDRDMAAVAGTVCLVGVLSIAVGMAAEIVEAASQIAAGTNISQYVQIVLKALGAALISHISAEICRSLGESSLAGAAELAGKLAITAMCLPVVRELLSSGARLLY